MEVRFKLTKYRVATRIDLCKVGRSRVVGDVRDGSDRREGVSDERAEQAAQTNACHVAPRVEGRK